MPPRPEPHPEREIPSMTRLMLPNPPGRRVPVSELELDWKGMSREAVTRIASGEGFLVPLRGEDVPPFVGMVPLREPAAWTSPLAGFTEKPLRAYWFSVHRHRRMCDPRVCLWGVIEDGVVAAGVGLLVDAPIVERYTRMFPSGAVAQV